MSSFIINFTNTSSEEGTVIADVGFLYSDKLNSVNDGNFVFSGSSELKRSLIEVGSQVKVYKNGTLDFHGLVDDIQFYDGGAMNVHASGYEIWLAKENGAYAGSPWTATASATIFSAVLAESNYFSAGTVNAGTSIDFRANISDSLLNVINNLRKKTAQDYQVDYTNTEIDILNHRGSTTSVETINAGIQIGDVQITNSYPIANKIKVYGQSEGQTRIESDTAQGQDPTSQGIYGVISYTIEDRTITTVAEANLLANAEVARLKDKRKIYAFDVLNPNKSWIAGDVLTLNALSQGVSAEEVRIVQIKRGIKDKREILEVEVTNKEYSELTKSRDEIIAELQKKSRDAATYDSYQSEYSNQNVDTMVGGFMTTDLTGSTLNSVRQVANDGAFTLGTTRFLIPSNGDGNADVQIWGKLDMYTNKIINLATPTSTYDAATKKYVDDNAGGDNLGNHIATNDLNMATYDIDNVRSVLASNNTALTIASGTDAILYLVPSNGTLGAPVQCWGVLDMYGNKVINTGTHYWSCPGDNFSGMFPDTDQIGRDGDPGVVNAEAVGIYFQAPVFLPHGAVVTNVFVDGNAGASAESWELERMEIASPVAEGMASANIGTADATISNATINNQTYMYHIITSSLDTGDKIYGARITYTI